MRHPYTSTIYHSPQIPVYRGCSGPLLAKRRDAGDYHGKDGLGDVPDPDAPGLDLLQKRRGVTAMIKTVNQNPGEVRQTPELFFKI